MGWRRLNEARRQFKAKVRGKKCQERSKNGLEEARRQFKATVDGGIFTRELLHWPRSITFYPLAFLKIKPFENWNNSSPLLITLYE